MGGLRAGAETQTVTSTAAGAAGTGERYRPPGARRRRDVMSAYLLAGHTAGFGYELTRPSVPPASVRLASWLLEHHLTYGLGGYWASSSVTVDSGQQVSVRALMQYTLKRDLWMAKTSWYDPKLHYADFVVLDSRPGNFSHWEPRRLIRKYFGVPDQTYRTGPYTIMVWHRNLLNDIPGHRHRPRPVRSR